MPGILLRVFNLKFLCEDRHNDMCNGQVGLGHGKRKMKDSGTRRSDSPNSQSLPKHYRLVLSRHYGDAILSSPTTRETISLMEA